MKIRSDYVSNSSSSSFVIVERANDATKIFNEDFGDNIKGEYEPMGESFNIRVQMESQKDSWDSYHYEDFIKEVEEGKLDFKDVHEISFDCDDWDSKGMMYLSFMYLYFKKLGFHPTDEDSERPISMDDTTIISKILKRIMPKEDVNED